MKRSPLKKKSTQTATQLKNKADRALQDFFRATDERVCESCGMRKADVRHHYIPKSQSSRLRYDPINLIALCNGCHFRYHRAGDQRVIDKVILKRGTKWLKQIQELRNEPVHINKTYLSSQILKWTTNSKSKASEVLF